MTESSQFDSLTAAWQDWYRKNNPPKEPPLHLFHYTSGTALHSILETSTLLGGNYAFMNDRSEFAYSSDVVRAVADSRTGKSSSARVAEFLKLVAGPLPLHVVDPYFVSFCEAGDLLSQWRGYGGTSGRYCIEFASRTLRRFSQAVSPALPVMYDYDRQRAAWDYLVTLYVDLLGREESLKVQDAVVSFFTTAIPTAVTFKRASFAEEREWRYVLITLANDTHDLTFFSSNGMMKPFKKILYGSARGEKLPISRVIAGASASERQEIRSAELMLRYFGYANVPVVLSDIPLAGV